MKLWMTLKMLSTSLNDGRFTWFPDVEFSSSVIEAIWIYCLYSLHPAVSPTKSFLALWKINLVVTVATKFIVVTVSIAIKYFSNLDAKGWRRANLSKIPYHIFPTCFGFLMYIYSFMKWYHFFSTYCLLQVLCEIYIYMYKCKHANFECFYWNVTKFIINNETFI